MRNIPFYLLLFLLALSQNSMAQDTFNVMIDAGHGGKDNGTTGSFSKEKNIVLDIAKLLANKSNETINIQLTRHSDEFIKLEERANKANSQDIDLFISLHCNHIHLSYVNGTEVYVYGHSDDQENQRIAQRENGGHNHVHIENEDLSFILGGIQESAYLQQSIKYGNLVSDVFSSDVKLKQRGLRQANFRVLKHLEMPGVLLEIAYLSNPQNETYINSSEGKNDVADAIWKTIIEYNDNLNLTDSALTITAN